MPLNVFDASFRSFETKVLPELNKRGIAALGMKPMNGNATAIKKGVVTAEEMLRYAMSLPVATTISGMDTRKVLQENLRIARNFKPMTPEEMKALRDACRTLAGDGRFEPYKLSLAFDNPQARRTHGFPLDIKQKGKRCCSKKPAARRRADPLEERTVHTFKNPSSEESKTGAKVMSESREDLGRPSRRGFLQTAGAIGAGVALAGQAVAFQTEAEVSI